MSVTPRLLLNLTLPPLLWAGNAVVGRMMVSTVPPLTLNALRWALAALVLLALAGGVLRDLGALRRRLPYLFAVGLLGVGMYNALQYQALVTSSPVNVTLVASSLPVWMLVVGQLGFGVRPTRRQLVGAALGLAGVVVVIAHGSWAQLARVQFVPGDLYMLVAIVAWAVYSWLLARPPESMRAPQRPAWGWAEFLLVQVLFGLVPAGAFAGFEQLRGAAPIDWGWPIAATLAYVSIAASIVAYRCWGLGVADGGPMLAAVFGNLTPLFAALLSALVLREPPRLHHLLAFALIAGGIAVNVAGQPQPLPAPARTGPR